MSETPDDSDGPDALDERPEAVSTTVSSNYKVLGETDAPDGSGVLGHNLATSGTAFGVEGVTASADNKAAGVFGQAAAGSGWTFGIHGVTQSPHASAVGVRGLAPAGDADGVVGIARNGGIGIGGTTDSTSQPAGFARNLSTTGAAVGHHGVVDSSGDDSVGVLGQASQGSGRTYGVEGISESEDNFATGVQGQAGQSGIVHAARGVAGFSHADSDLDSSIFTYGVFGHATGIGGTTGVFGNNPNDPDGWGVFGRALEGTGVEGSGNAATDGTTGVRGKAWAKSGRTYGVEGVTDSAEDGAAGVRGVGTATSGGVYGSLGLTDSPSGVGVVGAASDTAPLIGIQGGPTGIWGHTDKSSADPNVQFGTGVFGGADASSGETYGVTGSTQSPDGFAVYGTTNDSGGYAVYADGDSKTDGDHEVTGSQTVGDLGASAYLSTVQTIPSGLGGTQVAFDTIVADDRNEFDDTTGTFTCATDGDYRVAVGLEWQDDLAGDTLNQYFISTNGITHTRQRRTVPGTASETASIAVHLSRTIRGLTAGDEITILAGQNSGSDKSLQSGKPRTWVTIDKVG